MAGCNAIELPTGHRTALEAYRKARTQHRRPHTVDMQRQDSVTNSVEAANTHRRSARIQESLTDEIMLTLSKRSSLQVKTRTELEKLERTIWHFEDFVPAIFRARSILINVPFRHAIERAWMRHIAVDEHGYTETQVDLEEDWGEIMIRNALIKEFGEFEADMLVKKKEDCFKMMKYLWYMTDVLNLGWDPYAESERSGRKQLDLLGYFSPERLRVMPKYRSLGEYAKFLRDEPFRDRDAEESEE